MKMTLTLMLLAAAAMPGVLLAQVPSFISCQGRLMDDGIPVNGTRSVEI